MGDTHKVQANGEGGSARTPDGTNQAEGSGESGGGARTGQQAAGDGGHGGFLGHGGQSEIGYHGHGQLGDQKIEGDEQPNAGSKSG